MLKKKPKTTWRKIWYFIWEDNSIWSWIVNIVLAFILIKYIVYPGLGLMLGTGYPIVAVVSESMEHNNLGFDEWWEKTDSQYSEFNIDKSTFSEFPFKNGFNKGDIMVLIGRNPQDIKIGDVIVFVSARISPRADPIIHRVVLKEYDDGRYVFQTKGDNYITNRGQLDVCDPGIGCVDETDIHEEQILGRAVFKIPWLGYVKIWFVNLLEFFMKV